MRRFPRLGIAVLTLPIAPALAAGVDTAKPPDLGLILAADLGPRHRRRRRAFRPEYGCVPHLEVGRPGEYLTDRLTDEALRVIHHAGTQPFFPYLAHHAPHTPIEAKADDVKHFESKLAPGLHHRHP